MNQSTRQLQGCTRPMRSEIPADPAGGARLAVMPASPVIPRDGRWESCFRTKRVQGRQTRLSSAPSVEGEGCDSELAPSGSVRAEGRLRGTTAVARGPVGGRTRWSHLRGRRASNHPGRALLRRRSRPSCRLACRRKAGHMKRRASLTPVSRRRARNFSPWRPSRASSFRPTRGGSTGRRPDRWRRT